MNEPELPGLDPRRRRLLYRATHRGTHEADLLVGGFVARHVAAMTDAELAATERVLDHLDVDLADWLTGRRPVPPEADSPVLQRMRAEAGQ
ncbi:MAG: succinate dehydrogenase assembly factor 2 [Rhodospirillales bacterium]|jgi:antitoxin CptB|nr:succinate dehydrogenase assembly factor 2 [Rhodospirillales bacterium]